MKKLDKKLLKRTAIETSSEIYRDLTILLETDNLMKWENHPDYETAKEICAEYRRISPSTIKIRVQIMSALVKGKFYESVAKATNSYYLAAVKGSYLKGNDLMLATNNLNGVSGEIVPKS